MKIELQNISKSFGAVRANNDVSLVVNSGTIHGLLGENGAGKTTLMKILSGYQSYDSGRILLDGQPARFASPAEAIRAGVGMLHQDPLDVPPLTVLDNFLLGRNRRLLQGRETARRDLTALCSHFGFRLDPDVETGSLTMGERQQLELVRLLSLGVRVIILDEPTTGISAPQKVLLFETLHRLVAEGLSVIFVSHKLDEVETLCGEATILRRGTVSGHVLAPFSSDQLVELMFGQCLSRSARPCVPLGEPVLELDDVTLDTPRLRLQRLNLQVRQGEVIGLAGLEGSGQRVMMQACAGIQRVASGHLRIDGQEMTRRPYQRFLEMGVGFVPASRLEEGMVPGLTLREHVALSRDGALIDGNGPRGEHLGFFVPWRVADECTQALINTFHIVGRTETRVEELSGGNQQRALLALLPQRMRLLLLEHPTRGLDIGSAQWIWGKLLQRREQGTSILFTSTDLDELVEYSDRIIVFSGGVMSPPIAAAETDCEELGYRIGGRQR